ncbi:hypothetical protein ACLMJK_000354 [Lecanora helva]
MGEEHEPFLPINEQVLKSKKRQAWWRKSTFQVLAHAIILIIYTILFVAITQSYINGHVFRPEPAVSNLAIEYTQTLFHNLTGNPYAGPPSPELENAWDELLGSMHIRISKSELKHDNQESVILTEGGGYLGWLGVFHELHCIRMLREWHYRDYYHPDTLPEEEDHLESHIDHCFEMLRQSAVCHADASLTTFKWHPQKSRPMFNASESIHMCANWDLLMDSISDRVVAEDEILRLENPLMHER